MAERNNFLIGYGERLASDLAAPLGGAPKKHPYTFGEARRRLTPKIKAAVTELSELPAVVCPNDETVALVTLHPSYMAKSYYPAELLKTYGLDTIGSHSRTVSPEKWAKKKTPESAVTSELYVAGKRSRFRILAAEIGQLMETASVATDLIKIEDFRVEPADEKLKPFRSDSEDPLLEVVLHAQPVAEDKFILDGFEAYLKTLAIKADFDKRRFFAEGLCFMPLRVPREVAPEVVKYSFLRLAREMPRLRQFRPVARATPGFTPFACRLPNEEAVDREIRVAVFDGGVKADGKLDKWVARKKTKNIGDPVPEFQNHGTAVTSALLFGPLQDGAIADRPYATVDHYRVLDAETLKDDQQELYSVLERIQEVLDSRQKYDFVNLSLGPDLPMEDNDVHAWTAVLDQLFSDGLTLPAIAVGTGGAYGGRTRPSPHRWLSSVPAHWIVTRLKFVCGRIVDCLHETPEHADSGEYPSIRTANVERGRILIDGAKRVSEQEYVHRIQRLDAITVKEVLGHQSLNTTIKYTHPGRKKKQVAMELLRGGRVAAEDSVAARVDNVMTMVPREAVGSAVV